MVKIGHLTNWCTMMWFKNKRDEGITYPDYFNPVSVPSIALILTAVSCPFSFFCYEINSNLFSCIFCRLNAISTSGQLASRRISHFGQKNTARFMKLMSRRLPNSANMRNQKTWTSSVSSNASFTTMASMSLFY